MSCEVARPVLGDEASLGDVEGLQNHIDGATKGELGQDRRLFELLPLLTEDRLSLESQLRIQLVEH